MIILNVLAWGTIAAQAQSFREYGKCVTIPAGQESKYLLGGRADFMDGIRWTFNYDRTDRGVLTVRPGPKTNTVVLGSRASGTRMFSLGPPTLLVTGI